MSEAGYSYHTLLRSKISLILPSKGDARYDIQSTIYEQDPTVDIMVKDATV